MASPSKTKISGLEGMLQDDQSSSSGECSSRDATRATAPTRISVPNGDGPQTLPQNAGPLIMIPTAIKRTPTTPALQLQFSALEYPATATHASSVSNTEADGASSKDIKPRSMSYPANAMAPETSEALSIYPVDHRMQRIPITLEESTYPDVLPRPSNSWNTAFSLQHQVRKEVQRLWEEKLNELIPQSGPATAISEDIDRLDRDTGYRSDKKKSDGGPTPSEEARDIRSVLHESMDWDGEADAADSDREFSMFDDMPRDQSILSKKEELVSEPPEPDHAPSLSALSSMTEWDPKADLDFQNDAQWNLERWDDCRFKLPETPADIESLQQALEMTRMDFWIKNPGETYPKDLSKYKRETYGAQHRRLQHAFCRIWRDFDSDLAPELYRLPNWMFGFGFCYWKPSSWGHEKRSKAYNQGLADMVTEKNQKGLERLDYRNWKAKLEEILTASPTLEDWC